MKKLMLAVLMAAGALVAQPAMAVSLVQNVPTAGGIAFWGPGSFGGQSYGEVFTAPDSHLILFSFTPWYIDTPFDYVGQVYAWDGTQTTGPALFTSLALTTPSAPTTYSLAVNIDVTIGSQYIAFITNEPNGVSLGGTGLGEILRGEGPATFMFAEGDPSAPGAWQTAPGYNGNFAAQFRTADPKPPVVTPIPEPASWLLMLAGVGCVGAVMRRNRSATGAVAV